MRIEKISENQIRCILTKDDLKARHINLSELAYGSEKAKILFNEMMSYAYDQCGFEIENFPLMIEAVPLASDAILLIVTKIAYPDELDSRFANYSDVVSNSESMYDEGYYSYDNRDRYSNAKDIIEQCQTNHKTSAPIYRVYRFDSIDKIIDVAKVLDKTFSGKSDLYKDDHDSYYLAIHISNHTPGEFNKICNMIAEYGLPLDTKSYSVNYLHEHGNLIADGSALYDLSRL